MVFYACFVGLLKGSVMGFSNYGVTADLVGLLVGRLLFYLPRPMMLQVGCLGGGFGVWGLGCEG